MIFLYKNIKNKLENTTQTSNLNEKYFLHQLRRKKHLMKF